MNGQTPSCGSKYVYGESTEDFIYCFIAIPLNFELSDASLQALLRARRLWEDLRTTSARQPTSSSPSPTESTLLLLLLCWYVLIPSTATFAVVHDR